MNYSTNQFHIKLILFILSFLLVLAGCAGVDVRKVPTPTQYTFWSDQMQAEADSIEGFRFYLPRPFINVFESFPIRTDIYLATGKMSLDGKSVLIENVVSVETAADSGTLRWRKVDTGLEGVEISTLSVIDRTKSQNSNSSNKQKNSTDDPSAQAESSSDDSNKTENDSDELNTGNIVENLSNLVDANDTANKDDEKAPEESSSNNISLSPVTNTGISESKISNDNSAFAYQPLRGNFDIAYLPDFEEQYAISEKKGLGNVKFELNLGQGWSLQSYNALVDNSQLNQRIFNLLDFGVEAAKVAAGDVLGLTGKVVKGITDAQEDVIAQSSGFTDSRVKNLAENLDAQDISRPITLKIVVVHYAAKGLYPVLKPRELQERKTITPQLTMDSFVNHSKKNMGSLFNADAIKIARKHQNDLTGRFTVPKYPYQYISFNTFRYMAIERIDENTVPFGQLYDKTGTQGENGAAGSGDLAPLMKFISAIKQKNKSAKNTAPAPETCTVPEHSNWMQQHASPDYAFFGTTPNIFKLTNISLVGNANELKVHGEIDMEGDPTFPTSTETQSKFETLVSEFSKKLKQDENLEKVGCKNVVVGIVKPSTRLTAAIDNEKITCDSTTDDELIKCALETEVSTRCDKPISIEFVKYDKSSANLEVKALPASKEAFCENVAVNKITALETVVLTHVREGLKRFPKGPQIKVKSITFESANRKALIETAGLEDNNG